MGSTGSGALGHPKPVLPLSCIRIFAARHRGLDLGIPLWVFHHRSLSFTFVEENPDQGGNCSGLRVDSGATSRTRRPPCKIPGLAFSVHLLLASLCRLFSQSAW